MNSIWVKTKELSKFQSGYHGDLVIIGMLLMPIVSGNFETKYELDMT